MATVPGILVLGDTSVQGGASGLRAEWTDLASVTSNPLSHCLNRRIYRITPDNASTGAPTAGSLSCWPWYDGNACGTFYVITASSTTTAQVTIYPSGAPNLPSYAGRVLTVLNTSPVPTVGFAQRLAITSNTTDTFTFPATTAPTVGAICFPGQGRFTDYHPVAGFLNLTYEVGTPSSRGGSSWQALGLGVGLDATLVRDLLEDAYPTSPYCAVVKYASANGIVGHWGDSPNDGMRTVLLTEKTRIDAAATAHSNTIAWKHVVIDFTTADILHAIVTPADILLYKTQLQQLIAWLRSASFANNSTLWVHLIQHREDLYALTGTGGVQWIRQQHAEIARDDEYVRLVEMNDAEPGSAGSAPGAEVIQYSLRSYFDMGSRVSQSIVRANSGVSASSSAGFPVYGFIGDSICTGPMTSDWVTALASERYCGPNGDLIRPPNQLIWDRLSQAGAVYQACTNSNTSGSVVATAGSELELMAALGDLHPNGFLLVKRGANGSSLATALGAYSGGAWGRWRKADNEQYQEFLADIAGAVDWVNAQGWQADYRGTFVSLGQNDQAAGDNSGTAGAAFAAALPQFCADLWEDTTSRTSGDLPPIIWRRPQADTTGAHSVEIAAIRAAIEQLAVDNPRFFWTDVDDLERNQDDGIHETPASSLESGVRYVAALTIGAI